MMLALNSISLFWCVRNDEKKTTSSSLQVIEEGNNKTEGKKTRSKEKRHQNKTELSRNIACIPKLSVNCFIKSRHFGEYMRLCTKSKCRTRHYISFGFSSFFPYQHVINVRTFCERNTFSPWQRDSETRYSLNMARFAFFSSLV